MSVVNFPFYGNAIYGAFINLPTGVPDGTLAVTLDTYTVYLYHSASATWVSAASAPVVPILAPRGTVGAPAYSFALAPDTGMYNEAGTQLDFSTGGTKRLELSGAGAEFLTGAVFVPDGTAGTPGYTFRLDQDCGMYRNASNDIGFAVGGVQQLQLLSGVVRTLGGTSPRFSIYSSGVQEYSIGLDAAASNALKIVVGGTITSGQAITVSAAGDVVIGAAALATNATAGFFWVDTCAGTPTGVPSGTFAGRVPMIYDTTNHKIAVYDGGAWKQTAALT